jgi:hypothetical protein
MALLLSLRLWQGRAAVIAARDNESRAEEFTRA